MPLPNQPKSPPFSALKVSLENVLASSEKSSPACILAKTSSALVAIFSSSSALSNNICAVLRSSSVR